MGLHWNIGCEISSFDRPFEHLFFSLFAASAPVRVCVFRALQTALDWAKEEGEDAVVAFLTKFMSGGPLFRLLLFGVCVCVCVCMSGGGVPSPLAFLRHLLASFDFLFSNLRVCVRVHLLREPNHSLKCYELVSNRRLFLHFLVRSTNLRLHPRHDGRQVTHST